MTSENTKLPIDSGIEIINVTKADVLAARNAKFEREQAFFDYWKKGVEIAGYRFFGDETKEGFEKAKNKWDLSPISEKIVNSFGDLSHGEAAFLAAMYSFYNDFKGAELCAMQNVTSVGALTILDGNRRAVIAGLLVTYNGW